MGPSKLTKSCTLLAPAKSPTPATGDWTAWTRSTSLWTAPSPSKTPLAQAWTLTSSIPVSAPPTSSSTTKPASELLSVLAPSSEATMTATVTEPTLEEPWEARTPALPKTPPSSPSRSSDASDPDPSTTLLQESTGSLPKPPAPAVLPLPTSPLEEAPTWPSTTLLTPPL